jgi:pyrimidine operon attenuation protein / uracil phosphoribosyltransferase
MGDLADSPKVILMDTARMSRSIRRIAFNIAEESTKAPIVILGINERGFALAERLHKEIVAIPTMGCSSGKIEVATNGTVNIPSSHQLNGAYVVVVDDVMFSGKTMQLAIIHIISTFQPEIIRVASLIDRGHRKYPLEPKFVGLTCPTKLTEHVHVFIQPDSDHDSVVLYQHTKA